jgi:hypothetical protein
MSHLGDVKVLQDNYQTQLTQTKVKERELMKQQQETEHASLLNMRKVSDQQLLINELSQTLDKIKTVTQSRENKLTDRVNHLETEREKYSFLRKE